MLFDKNDNKGSERTLYKTKPNMILGCKKAILGFIILLIVLSLSQVVIQYIGEMQVYMISYTRLPLTRYAAIAFFVVILIIILYIIWQLIRWYSIEYILTNSRIIVKSGVLFNKKSYMPYAKIQDINTSQSILARLFNVGSVSLFSAYDNNQIKLENISDPSKVEDIIFENMVSPGYVPQEPRGFVNRGKKFREDYSRNNDYYDEYEPITPINREIDNQRREYEYYPEDRVFDDAPNQFNQYEYEPYDDVGYNIGRAMDNIGSKSQFEGYGRDSQNSYYEEVRGEYSYNNDDYYDDNGSELYYNDPDDFQHQEEDVEVDNSSETVIRRHFDKFKK